MDATETIRALDKAAQDGSVVIAIVKRASEMTARMRPAVQVDEMSLFMDIEHCHRDIPLKLDALLAADDFNFAHDVFGIRAHMNRVTGKLNGAFVPRFAVNQG